MPKAIEFSLRSFERSGQTGLVSLKVMFERWKPESLRELSLRRLRSEEKFQNLEAKKSALL